MKLLCLVGMWLVGVSTWIVQTETKHDVPSHTITQMTEYLHRQETQLPRYLTPINYKLKLQPLGQEGPFHHYRGHVYINISCVEPTDTIVLHAHNDLHVSLVDTDIFSVGQWEETNMRSSLEKTEDSHQHHRILSTGTQHNVTILRLTRDITKDRFELILSEKLKERMVYQLKLEFTGNISNDGSKSFFHQIYEDYTTKAKRWYMAVDMNTHGGRNVFPCFDEKHFKATFEFSIIRPDKMKAISTMPLSFSESVIHRAGWRKDHFKRSPPMSVNGFSVVIFDSRSLIELTHKHISGHTTLYAYGHPKFATTFQLWMDQVAYMIQRMENYTGISFPLPELTLLAIPQTTNPGNSWGIIRFSDRIFSEDFVYSVIPKQVMDQWIEHLITPCSTEVENIAAGLKIYLIYNSLKDLMKTEQLINYKSSFSYQLFYELGFTHVTPRSFAAHKPILIAMVMRMLNYTLTENSVKKGFHSFIRGRSFKTVFKDDFYDTLDNEAWLNGVLPVSMSTRDIAKSWIDKKRFPVVTVVRNYINKTATIEQHTFLREWPHEAMDRNGYTWWIPLMYLTRVNLELNSFMTLGWLRDKRIVITNLPHRDTFIILNPENIGLFMVNYDETNWHLLSEYLVESVSSEKKPKIPAGTRSKLLYDAIYLALGGELEFDVALDMTLFIKHERDHEVWHTIHDLFGEIEGILYDTPLLPKFLIFLRYTFAPAFEYYKGEMDSDTLIAAGYEPLLEKSRSEFHMMLENNSFVDISLRILCGIFRWSDEDWDLGVKRAINIHMTNQSNDQAVLLLSNLAACTSNPENLSRLLSIVLIGNNTFTGEEIEEIIGSVTDYPSFIQFISNNWNSLESRFRNKPHLWDKIFEEATKDIKTKEGYELASELYHIFHTKMGSARKILENSLQTIKANVFGKYKYLPVIDTWLNRQLLSLTV